MHSLMCLKQKLHREQQAKRLKVEDSSGEKNFTTMLKKHLGFILGNRKSFRKILRQPWRGSFVGAGLEEQESCRRPGENWKTKRLVPKESAHTQQT